MFQNSQEQAVDGVKVSNSCTSGILLALMALMLIPDTEPADYECLILTEVLNLCCTALETRLNGSP